MRFGIYCGSSKGNLDIYASDAITVVEEIARIGGSIAYGGGNIGLMGVVSQTALELGVPISGVITEQLVSTGISQTHLQDFHIVQTMHERKMMLSELSDAFITLPGGGGTMDEISEQWTWAQLGLHTKPIAFLNSENYFQHYQAFLLHMVTSGFVSEAHMEMLIFERDPRLLIDQILNARPVTPRYHAEHV
jgi:uncharacterized protein (TIGR00730 family)